MFHSSCRWPENAKVSSGGLPRQQWHWYYAEPGTPDYDFNLVYQGKNEVVYKILHNYGHKKGEWANYCVDEVSINS